jgi:hypothetical protein
VLLVTTSPLVKFAAPGMKKDIFGGVTVKTFDTPEEALEYARSQIANKA